MIKSLIERQEDYEVASDIRLIIDVDYDLKNVPRESESFWCLIFAKIALSIAQSIATIARKS